MTNEEVKDKFMAFASSKQETHLEVFITKEDQTTLS
jgi:hypothetical protein